MSIGQLLREDLHDGILIPKPLYGRTAMAAHLDRSVFVDAGILGPLEIFGIRA